MSIVTKELSDQEFGETIFALFKGGPTTRKTTAAASFPDFYEFDLDNKIINVKKIFPHKKISFSHPRTIDEILEILESWIDRSCPFQTVCLDSLTSLALMSLREANRLRGPNATRLMKGEVELNQIEDYNYETKAIFMLVDKLLTLHLRDKINVILIAHVVKITETNIKTKKVTETRTLLTGGKKVAGMLPTQFQEIYHFGLDNSMLGEPGFEVITQSMEEDFAGTALPLPKAFTWTNENFYEKWKSLIEEGKKSLAEGVLIS